MIEVALHLFGLVGATIIFTSGTIFARVRRVWPKFLGCPLCVGFWVGVANSLRVHGLGQLTTATGIVDVVIDGAIVALASLMVEGWIVSKLGEKESDE